VIGYLLTARVPTMFAGGTLLHILKLAVDESRRGSAPPSMLR
jgi:hypothetical protein